MIEWLSWTEAAICALAGVGCLVAAGLGRKPDDLTVGVSAVGWLGLVIDVVLCLAGPAMGNPCLGDGLELWLYLLTAIIIPPAAVFWGLIERSRWSTAILGVAMLAVAVMIVRMQQIWVGAGPLLVG